jgi:hypothetical protein
MRDHGYSGDAGEGKGSVCFYIDIRGNFLKYLQPLCYLREWGRWGAVQKGEKKKMGTDGR